MKRSFIIYQLLLIYQSFSVILMPEHQGKIDNVEELKINIDGVDIILKGIFCAEELKIKQFPLIYSPDELIEDIQGLENSIYYIEVKVFDEGEVSIVNKLHSNSISPLKEIQTLDKKIIKGRFNWKSYVGKDNIIITMHGERAISLPIEIRSRKIDYLTDYKNMVNCITEKLADIIWSNTSPTTLKMVKTFDKEPSLLEKFFYIRQAMTLNYIPSFWQLIASNPTFTQKYNRKDVGLGEVTDIDFQAIVSIVSRPEYLRECNIRMYNLPNLDNRLPEVVNIGHKRLMFDTPENRFLLYWFKEIQDLLEEILSTYDNKSLVHICAQEMMSQVKEILEHNMFNEVTEIGYFDNSNLGVQRLPGYSGVFEIYQNYNKCGQLFWDDYWNLLYDFEAKPVYDIYEIWVLFQLIDILKEISTGDIQYDITEEGSKIRGVSVPFETNTVKLTYQKKCASSASLEMLTSYSIQMIPDYTISIWNGSDFLGGITLDAKYKYDVIREQSNRLDNECDIENLSGGSEGRREAKKIDLDKMHCYKDAIRGIFGAYVIFPGKEVQGQIYCEQYTALPSIGAFPLYPSNDNLDMINKQRKELKDFLVLAVTELTL